MNSRGIAVVLRLIGIGWYVAICIGGGTFGGWWLDDRLGLDVPAFTLSGLGLGIVLAAVGMLRMLRAVLAGGSDSKSLGE